MRSLIICVKYTPLQAMKSSSVFFDQLTVSLTSEGMLEIRKVLICQIKITTSH